MRRFQLLLPLLFLWTAGAATAGFVPEPYSAEYTVHANGLKVGEMKRRLVRRGDDTWLLENRLYTTGLVAVFKNDELKEQSIWRNDGTDIVPLDYRYHYTGRNKNVLEKLDFHWESGYVESLRDGRETRLPLSDGVMDKLVYQIALQRDLAAGARHLEYQVADRSKLETYTFDVVGEERLKTSLGELDTVKVRKGTTTLWCAPSLDYLVIKILQEEDDYTLASYITAMEQSAGTVETAQTD